MESDFEITRFNHAFEHLTGRIADEVLGNQLDVLFPEDSREASMTFIRKTIVGERWDAVEIPILHRDGTVRVVLWNSATVYASDGKTTVSTIAQGQDITDRKQAEEQLHQYREHLEQLVEERSGELQEATRRIFDLQEKERREIAKELHDQTGQYLTALRLMLGRARKSAAGPTGTLLDEANSLVGEMVTQVRSMSLNLRPAMLDDMGLLHTLLWHFENYQKQTGIAVDFKHRSLNGKLAPEINTAAYRIIQEALTNAARYSGVQVVNVRIEANQELNIIISDKGKGFTRSEAEAKSSNGISGMRERAFLVGGKVTIESLPGAGTTVTAVLPLSPPPRKTA